MVGGLVAKYHRKLVIEETVPIGGGIEEVVRLGGQRMKLSVDAYYNAIRPTAGNDTALVQVTLTFLFPP